MAVVMKSSIIWDITDTTDYMVYIPEDRTLVFETSMKIILTINTTQL
jgi:hypothetical protein